MPWLGKTIYWPDSDLGAGFGAGFAFFAGLETPKLRSKKPNPLRNESSKLMVPILFHPSLPVGPAISAAAAKLGLGRIDIYTLQPGF
jgi:hypothetical protein